MDGRRRTGGVFMRKKRIAALCLTAALISGAMPVTALADTAIDSVSLDISSEIVPDDDNNDVDVSVDSSHCDVDDVEVTNEPSGDWEAGDEPRIRVTLAADRDYYFASGFDEKDVDLSGDDGEVTSVSRSRDELRISIRLAELEDEDYDGDYDLDVSGLEWDDYDGTAYWDDAEDAKKYEVRLYRNGSSVTSVKTTSNTDYNFSDEFTRSGDYYFRVRAVRNSSNKGTWEESEELSVTSSEARDIRENGESSSSSSSSGGPGSSSGGPGSNSGGPGVSGTSAGAWLWDNNVGRWWYCNADKTYTVNNWQYIGNSWFYFDAQGYMVTGWQFINGAWYYMDNNGYMLTGWQYINNRWYFLHNPNGNMITGWVQTNGLWYYCDASGAMLTNTYTPDGYYVDGSGVWRQ